MLLGGGVGYRSDWAGPGAWGGGGLVFLIVIILLVLFLTNRI